MLKKLSKASGFKNTWKKKANREKKSFRYKDEKEVEEKKKKNWGGFGNVVDWHDFDEKIILFHTLNRL